MQNTRNIDKLKNKIKDTSTAIRQIRLKHKEAQRNGTSQEANMFLRDLIGLKYDIRHHHIAYCELRGRSRDEIERFAKEDNSPSERYINRIKAEYAWSEEEITRYNERQEIREKALRIA